jgi:hypothetical protein
MSAIRAAGLSTDLPFGAIVASPLDTLIMLPVVPGVTIPVTETT